MGKALQAADCEYDMEFADKNSQGKLCLPNKMLRGSHYDGIIFIGNFENSYVDFITQKSAITYVIPVIHPRKTATASGTILITADIMSVSILLKGSQKSDMWEIIVAM